MRRFAWRAKRPGSAGVPTSDLTKRSRPGFKTPCLQNRSARRSYGDIVARLVDIHNLIIPILRIYDGKSCTSRRHGYGLRALMRQGKTDSRSKDARKEEWFRVSWGTDNVPMVGLCRMAYLIIFQISIAPFGADRKFSARAGHAQTSSPNYRRKWPSYLWISRHRRRGL